MVLTVGYVGTSANINTFTSNACSVTVSGNTAGSTITVTDVNASTVTFGSSTNVARTQFQFKAVTVYYTVPVPGTVTISDDKSEASFEMPQSDITVTYVNHVRGDEAAKAYLGEVAIWR